MGITKPIHYPWKRVGCRVSDQNQPRFDKAPERVVSLVPSITASLFDLKLADCLVGVTNYCPQPETEGSAITTIGGTRDPSVDKILELKPDLILANKEENNRDSIEQLKKAGLTVWITFPRTIEQAIENLWSLVKIIPSNPHATNVILLLERSLEWTRRAYTDQAPVRVFYPIWMDAYEGSTWFMTIHQTTYAHDVLKVCGAENVFSDRLRRYPLEADLGMADEEDPGERDCRYPRVPVDEVLESRPELILVPDEPFPFAADHIKQIASLLGESPAARLGNIRLVDGRLVHWHGTMLARALTDLPPIIQDLSS